MYPAGAQHSTLDKDARCPFELYPVLGPQGKAGLEDRGTSCYTRTEYIAYLFGTTGDQLSTVATGCKCYPFLKFVPGYTPARGAWSVGC